MTPETAHANLTVDLAAVAANWRLLRDRHPSGPTGAAVKGNAYGLGVIPVCEALYAAGCRHFFVATPDEGLALRARLPDVTLISLGGLFPGSEAELAAANILPALGSLAEIAAWSALARTLDRELPAFLHFDTGMSRLGLDARELAILADDHSLLRGIGLRCVMSHLVSAEAADDPLNARQRDRFDAGRARLPRAPASLVNSSGIFRGFAYDLARPGVALYGGNPTPGQPNPMRPVVTLTGRILALRDIPAGATVGYSATWTAPRPSRIATVGIGYADGWHRIHSNAGTAFFDGTPVPLVGRVSMDLTTFDVTNLPAIRTGDMLEFLGPHWSVDDAARAAGTIGYEILTSLGGRYHRVYRSA